MLPLVFAFFACYRCQEEMCKSVAGAFLFPSYYFAAYDIMEAR